MVEYLTPAKLQEAYNDVVELGIDGLKDLETKHVYQLKRKAEDIFQESIRFINGLLKLNPGYPLPEEFEGTAFEYFASINNKYQESEYVMHVISVWEQKKENKQNKKTIKAIQAWYDSIQERYQEKHSKPKPATKFRTDSKSFVRLLFEKEKKLRLLDFENLSYEKMAKKIALFMDTSDHAIFDIIEIERKVKWQTIKDYISDLHSEKRKDYHKDKSQERYIELKTNVLNYI
jgi:hypothetical protein